MAKYIMAYTFIILFRKHFYQSKTFSIIREEKTFSFYLSTFLVVALTKDK